MIIVIKSKILGDLRDLFEMQLERMASPGLLHEIEAEIQSQMVYLSRCLKNKCAAMFLFSFILTGLSGSFILKFVLFCLINFNVMEDFLCCIIKLFKHFY